NITFSNCPLEQKIIRDETQQTVFCSASAGGIDLTTYWKRQDQLFQIQADGNKYAITSAGLIIFNVSEEDEMIYELYAKYDKTSASEYRNITVKVLTKPVILLGPPEVTVTAGDRFSIGCLSYGDPAPMHDWYKEETTNQWSLLNESDRIIIDKVNGVLQMYHIRKDDEGQYKCKASNEAGSSESQARVDVQVRPNITEIHNAIGEENGGAVITCKASGDPAPELTWKPNFSDTFYPEGQSGDISVTLTKDQINQESTLQLKFTNLKPSHMGDYTCQAHNDAGDDIGYGHLIVRYAVKFNNQPTGPFYNWYGNEKGNVTCVVNGNPLPVVQWFKGGNQITGQTSYSIQTIEDKGKFQVTSILSARMDLSNEQQILGDYTCQGLNAAGVNNITIRMVRAEKPPAPGVSVDQFTARIIRLVINTPTVRGPPVSKFVIKYKVQGSNENPVTIEAPVEWINYALPDDHPLPRTYVILYDLAAKTNYVITLTAVNDVGESAPYEFTQTTRPYSVPQSVKITSPFQDSLSPTSFLLMWDKPEDGGSKIQKYILNYREVEIIPNRILYELFKPLSGFINVDDIPPSAVRYQLSSLTPGTYYQVEVQAVNKQGSSTPISYIFKTKEGEVTTMYPRTSVRLVEIKDNPVGSGILVVRFDDQWGTVCDDDFDNRDADVFCRMLGFYNWVQYFITFLQIQSLQIWTFLYTSELELTIYPIWMDELNCMGNESDIAECGFNGWGRHDCRHSEDVMLFCSNDSATTTESNSRQPSLDITPNRWYATHWWYYISSVFTSTTAPLYPTTSSNSLDSAITSSCTSSGWYIQVDMYRLRQMYPNARESDIYLGVSSCTGYSNGNTLVFQHGIRDCLTSEMGTPNYIVHRNRLVYAMRDPQYQFIIRNYNWTFEVKCYDFRNESPSSHISHNTIEPLDSGHVQGTSHYNITMRFYSDPSFQDEIPGNPLYVKVGNDVYVKVYTDTADWGIGMSVRSCYTKPDPYASDDLKYYIIREGCEADENTRYISQSKHETKFMFRDFEYASNHEGLYLYCDATFCETSNYSYQCQQSCDPSGKREAESRPRLTETVLEKIIHIRL
ncbi:hypothetical protein ACJMK2_024748, partial [Sinanodonta woodiana]